MKSFNKVHTVLLNILMAISKIIILIFLLPFFIVLICPCYLIRFIIVTIASKIFRPDLICCLGVRDMFYAVDDITTCPKSSIVVTIIFKGKMKREVLIKIVEDLVSLRKFGETELLYPELKRYLVKWMGFIFWKEDKNFTPENHIVYVNPTKYVKEPFQKINENVLKQIENKLVQEKYPELRSPWSLHILENYQPREFTGENFSTLVIDDNGNKSVNTSTGEELCTALMVKMHHSFVDGYSMLNLLLKEICKSPSASLYKPNFLKRSFLQEMILKLFIIFKAPYDILSEAIMDADNNPWYLTRDKVTNVIHSASSVRISSKKIKSIATNMQGSFTSVVISAISGGIRRFMVERGEIKGNNGGGFTCLAPFPVEGHPETLGNYLSDCYLEFPIGIANAVLRLRKIEKQLHEIKNSTVALSSFVMQPIFGGLFHWMVKPLVEFATAKSTGVFSSFPGPKVPIRGPNGGEVLDAYFTAGHDSPGIGIQFLALNYNEGWKLKIQADQGTLSSEAEVEKLLGHILCELESYENIIVV